MYEKRVNVAQAVVLVMPIVVPLASGKHLLPTLQRRHCHCLNLWAPFCFVWCKHFASQVHLFLNARQGPRRASPQSASAATSTLGPHSICVGVADFLSLAGLPQFDAIDFRPHPHPPAADPKLHSEKMFCLTNIFSTIYKRFPSFYRSRICRFTLGSLSNIVEPGHTNLF